MRAPTPPLPRGSEDRATETRRVGPPDPRVCRVPCLPRRGCPTIRHAQHAVEHGITNFSGVGWLLAATRKRKGTRPCLTGQAWHPATTNHATNCRTASPRQACRMPMNPTHAKHAPPTPPPACRGRCPEPSARGGEGRTSGPLSLHSLLVPLRGRPTSGLFDLSRWTGGGRTWAAVCLCMSRPC